MRHKSFQIQFVVCKTNNQLTVMYTIRSERRLISIRCQKECVGNELDRLTDSHSDFDAQLWVVQNVDTIFLIIVFY